MIFLWLGIIIFAVMALILLGIAIYLIWDSKSILQDRKEAPKRLKKEWLSLFFFSLVLAILSLILSVMIIFCTYLMVITAIS